MFNKPTFSLSTFTKSVAANAINAPRLIVALAHPSTSRQLREQVMLACTAINDCRYCRWLHTRLALANGVDVDALNDYLVGATDVEYSNSTKAAIAYAQQFAKQQRQISDNAKAPLNAEFNTWQRLEINAYLEAIYLGNLTGNTLDALLSRLQGRPSASSDLLSEIIISAIGAPFLLSLMAVGSFDKQVKFGTLH